MQCIQVEQIIALAGQSQIFLTRWFFTTVLPEHLQWSYYCVSLNRHQIL